MAVIHLGEDSEKISLFCAVFVLAMAVRRAEGRWNGMRYERDELHANVR